MGKQWLMPVNLASDLCSLDVGSLNFRARVFINPVDWVEKAAQRMLERGVKPKMEVFDADFVSNGLVIPRDVGHRFHGKWATPSILES
ncbi:hypothetical protein DFAR_3930001 [Desulfarculales bacterium]